MSAQLRHLSTIWSALCRQCPDRPTAYLYRLTEGHYAERVRLHGTDRFGLDRPVGCSDPPWTAADWRRLGYAGPFRPFADVIYASTVAEIEASIAGKGSSALAKIAVTAQPYVIVYRADALVSVGKGQYAFVDAARRRDAVVTVVSVARLAGGVEPP